MRTLPLLAALLLSLAACRDDCGCGKKPGKTTPAATVQAWRGSGDEIELSVGGMMCVGCLANVEKAIQEIDGVVAAEGDLESTVFKVKIKDPAQRDAIVAKIRAAVHAEKKTVVGEDAESAGKQPGA